MKRSIGNLERKLDRLLTVPSDFSSVTVRVQSEAGKALAGFQARLVAQAKEGRYISVSGTSDESGVAIERTVPYGKYHLSLKEPSGWSTYLSDVVVEIGKDLDLAVVAPDPSERGEIVLVSQLRKEAFADLPFGELQERVGSGYAIPYTPEPSEREQLESFPTVGYGLSAVGARVTVNAVQQLRQVDGQKVIWRWSDPESRSSGNAALVLTPEGVWRLHGLQWKIANPQKGGQFFGKLEANRQVGFLATAKVERLGKSHRVEVPLKEVEIVVSELLGEATPAVAESLEQTSTNSIWLKVNLKKDSQWLPRLFDLHQWEQAAEGNAVLKRSLALPPGKEVEVVLAAP
ncbi:MAG: carboxypeptidase-like regulatory domain-containing protein [Aureliella sp.]